MARRFDYMDKVEDRVTGYVGRVTAYVNYFGMDVNSYRVESNDTTGRPVEEWIAESRLESCEED